MVKIAASILNKNDNETIKKLNNTDVDYLHIDVMDGAFVEPTNFPLSKIEEVNCGSVKPLDVHLMVQDPLYYIDQLTTFNIHYITVHYEALNGDISIFEKIKKKGIKCGLSVKPITDIKDIFYLLDNIDLVLIMSVEPGYGAQDFITSSLSKVTLLKEEIIKRKLNTIISIDGGINGDNAKSCVAAGCDMLVAGSYIMHSEDYQNAINNLRNV